MGTRLIVGDCLDVLRTLDAGSVECCVTSPPYFGLRDYGVVGQIGLEATPDAFVAKMVQVFAEVRRVLKDDATLWLNLGDSYAGVRGNTANAPGFDGKAAKGGASLDFGGRGKRPSGDIKAKDLIGIPWRVAFALQADGWYLRSDIIWAKPNPMPESVTDRPTKAHEYLFLLAKSERYYYDADAIAEPFADERMGASGARSHPYLHAIGVDTTATTLHTGSGKDTRNRRTVWTVATQPYSGAHFATFPPALIEPCILAGSRVGDTVLDPFGGAGTTGLVADRLSRNALLIELNPAYAQLARDRITDDSPLFAKVESA